MFVFYRESWHGGKSAHLFLEVPGSNLVGNTDCQLRHGLFLLNPFQCNVHPIVNKVGSDEIVVNTNHAKNRNKTSFLLLKSSNTKQIETGLVLLSVATHA
jgi:hypothetical protein